MTARTHDAAAITALALVVWANPVGKITLGTALIVLLANQIGGIVPDIDQPTAPFWRNLPITRLFGKYFDNLVGGHRFLTHSLLGVALFGFLAKAFFGFYTSTYAAYQHWLCLVGLYDRHGQSFSYGHIH